MAQKISECARISPELVWKLGERAMKEWEKKEDLKLNQLFAMRSDIRMSELNKMLGCFQQSMKDIVNNQAKLERSMNIAAVSFEIMFDLI